ncbi:hypothetical protein TRVL_04121 [Trypanosoma vivax]|nr:hypothetical protein TRVL_04121 [Trypanosoma vivax]
MRFKATIQDQRMLASMCQVCRRTERGSVVVKLHREELNIFTCATAGNVIRVWASCPTDSVFRDFVAQSTSASRGSRRDSRGGDAPEREGDDAILCEIEDTSRLLHALRQAERFQHASIKLTKSSEELPVLRVSVKDTQLMVDVSHDVPVQLPNRKLMDTNFLTSASDALCITLPGLEELTTFVEKLRIASCERATFIVYTKCHDSESGQLNCNLVVEAESTHASFELEYKSLPLKCFNFTDDKTEKGCRMDRENEHDDGDGSRIPGLAGDCRAERPREVLGSISINMRLLGRFFPIRDLVPHMVYLLVENEDSLKLAIITTENAKLVAHIPALVD